MPRKRNRDEVLGTLVRAGAYLKPYKLQLAGVLATILVFTASSLAFPRLMGMIIDQTTKPNGWSMIVRLLIVYILFLIVRSLSQLSRNYLMQRTGMRVTCDLRVAIFSHLQKLSLKFYDERQTGRIVGRVIDDSSSMHVLVTGASVTLFTDLFTAVGVFFWLFWINWELAVPSVICAPLLVINYRWHRRRMRMESRRHSRNWQRVLGFVNERVANNRIVRAFGTESVEENAFRLGIENDYANYNRVVWRNTLLSTMAEYLSGLGQFIALGVGALLLCLHAKDFTPGALFAFLGYLGMLYTPIVNIVAANVVIQKGVTAMEKIFALLDTKPHIPENDALPAFPRMQGKVEFRDVSFGYRIGQATLDRVSFTVAPGEMVALVGPSGAGKSTIITLLARFYDPTAGAVLVDDRPITDYNVQSVRRQVGIVMQDSILFSGTLAENIRYGRPDASMAEIIAAAKAANAHDFIMGLKSGYETRAGERGVSLSGGQRQRIAIARVLLKDPRILILDEATSALDSQAERLIQEATEKLMRDRTAIVIAHRLSTVVNASRILVMERGRIVDAGTHAELLARPGLYRDLYQLQFADRAAA
ncbi:MAG TPA: ABC transporter ATP-binding protein [Candidatus Methylacidiphilales bacterium]|nr:ABC transporter ATP-binding protein [Candidatus Methylacidiphilales bacterium]